LLFIIIILSSIFLIKEANAVGLYFPNDNEMDFSPGAEKIFNFMATQSKRDVKIEVSGYLSEYAELSKTFIKAGSNERAFQVRIKLPDEIENPGHHKIWVSAEEIISPDPGGDMIGTSSNTRVYLLIHVLNPGKYVEMDFIAPDANINETINFNIKVKNFGKQNINSMHADIEIYDPNNQKIKTIKTDKKSLKSNEQKSLNAEFDTTGHLGGKYRATAILNYDENIKNQTKPFKIGDLNIEIINYTEEFEKDKINKIDIVIESDWGNRIDGVYGEIKVREQTIKTPNIEIEPWEREKLTTYLDTIGWEDGKYDANIDIYYEGKKTSEKASFVIFSKKEPLVEMPANISFGIITSLLLVIILLIIINLKVISSKKEKKKKKR
jgi:hypothetical protein